MGRGAAAGRRRVGARGRGGAVGARVVQGGASGRGAAGAAAAGGDGVARRRRHVGVPPRLQVRQARRLHRLLRPTVSNPSSSANPEDGTVGPHVSLSPSTPAPGACVTHGDGWE